MAIRDVGGGRPPPSASPSTGGGAGGIPASLEKGLTDAGVLKPGGNAKDAAQSVLTNLKSAGFQAPAKGDVATQLSAALKQFQQSQKLQQTGRLDAPTTGALGNAGLLPGQEAPREPTHSEKASRDGFERAAPTLLKQGERQRADAAKNGTPDTNFLDALLNKLGGDHGVTSDRAGHVGGTAESSTQTAKAESTKDTKKASESEQKRGAPSDSKDMREASNQQLDKAQAARVQVARGLKAEQTRTDEQRRKDALAGKNPTERGILDEEADEEDGEGDGGEGKKRGRGGDQHDGGHDERGSTTGGAGTDGSDGAERDAGNATSGDRDLRDARRGNAGVGNDVDGEGHWRMPSLSEQAFSALQKIARDKTADNRATTYSWDVTFFRPGVYGAGQKGHELVHLIVDKATAFDPVWQKAQANLQAMVRRLESNAPVPTLDDIVHALRQARARDGDVSAISIGKLPRPPGRA